MENMLQRVLVFDGAMGTLLQEKGLEPGACPELMNLAEPEKVKEVHEAYLLAGADVITTNTFGGNRIKLAEYGLADRVVEINKKAVEIAREALLNYPQSFVAATIGPTGRFVEPLGKMTFLEAYEIFKEQIEALVSAKPDFLILETFSDLGEIRAALLAARDTCTIPVICSLTFTGRKTLTGVSPASAAVVLESMGAQAIGANCSGGPEELFPVVKEIAMYTKLPVIVQPNAGLPQVKEGKVSYPLGPADFLQTMEPFFTLGINIFGSCCGSTPEHTRLLKTRLADYQPPVREVIKGSFLASREKVVIIGSSTLPKIIGERINPTARKKLAEDMKEGSFALVQAEAQAQQEAGAHLLDINIGAPGINEVETIGSIINLLQQNILIPLVIDSTNPEVIEKGLQVYHGKALVNSVNGEEASLNKILPLVKCYGAGVIALTLDEKGIPSRAEERLLIAERIIDRCMRLGIPREDIYVDCLALTIGTDDRAALETLRAIKMVKEKLKVNTVLGVSNVSYGLPNRSKINAAFLAMVLGQGLDLAIINPLDTNMLDIWQSASLLAGRDAKGQNYLYLNSREKDNPPKKEQGNLQPSLELLNKLVVTGSRQAVKTVEGLLEEGVAPLEIINKGLVPGLILVGEKYEKGEYYLPQLMLSAETAQSCFTRLEKCFKEEEKLSKGTIVIGTVKGDIHDIGKNMVAVMLRNHGFKVVDLGKNVSKEDFLKSLQKEKADILALSALMTTTMQEIPKTIDYVKKHYPEVKIIAGGAVVTKEFALNAGADGYGKDAVEAVKLVESLRG
ncbi:MAG: dihydropteroate synthase [Clostridia bacterium]|nr:dihydropteroate synthase [Clostridia bacterium]